MLHFFQAFLREVVGLGQHSYDYATELIERVDLAENEGQARRIITEAIGRVAQANPLVGEGLRITVNHYHNIHQKLGLQVRFTRIEGDRLRGTCTITRIPHAGDDFLVNGRTKAEVVRNAIDRGENIHRRLKSTIR